MKKILLSTALVFSSLLGFSQAYDEEVKTLNIQMLAGYSYNPASGYTNSSELPGFMLSYDLGVHEFISIAPYFYFQHSNYEYDYNNNNWNNNHSSYWGPYTSKVKYNNIGLGARGIFHFGNMIDGLNVEKLDLYGGLGMGFAIRLRDEDVTYYNNAYPSESRNSTNTDFEYDLFVGARWYFSDGFAINAELGYGVSVAKLGVTFKL